MKVIGVTGGVGSGKSEILHYLESNYKSRIILADDVARALEAPGGAIYGPLVELLEQYPAWPAPEKEDCVPAADGAASGDGKVRTDRTAPPVTLPDGRINNPEMARRIFSQPELLGKVNALVHPAVKTHILEECRRAKEAGVLDLFIMEAALLIEGGYRPHVDALWYIYCEREERRRRLKASRGYSDEKIDDIIARQLSEEEYRRNVDVIIDNSGALEDSCRQVDEALAKMNIRKIRK